MSGMRRAGKSFVLIVMTACILVLPAKNSHATPIKPDVHEVLSRPTPEPDAFPPARAGWDGPEMPRTVSMPNATYDQLGPSGTARQVRQSLISAFIPDYRALAGITLVIMLLRRIVITRRRSLAKLSPVTSIPSVGATSESERAA